MRIMAASLSGTEMAQPAGTAARRGGTQEPAAGARAWISGCERPGAGETGAGDLAGAPALDAFVTNCGCPPAAVSESPGRAPQPRHGLPRPPRTPRPAGKPMEALPVITQDTPARECRAAKVSCTYEVSQALQHSGKLGDLIDSSTLSPDGMATAHSARALLYAILALRETIAGAAGDTADAVTDLDATLGIIAGAVTDAVTGGTPEDPR